jgi:hypothetical protein
MGYKKIARKRAFDHFDPSDSPVKIILEKMTKIL